MISRVQDDMKRSAAECDEQLKDLFTYFGKFLCDNVNSGKLSYSILSDDEGLEKKVKSFLDAGKPCSRRSDEENKNTGSRPDFRGSVEPYTELIVSLFEARKQVQAITSDVEECVTLAMLPFKEDNYRTEVLLHRIEEKKKGLLLFISNNMEVITNIMKEKQQKIKDDRDKVALLSKEEKSFLARASKDVGKITREVASLVEESKKLLMGIKDSYEEDLAKNNAEPMQESPVIHVPEEEVPAEEFDDIGDEEKESAEENEEEDEEEEDAAKDEDDDENEDEDQEEDEDEDEEPDMEPASGGKNAGQGLKDAAYRRLSRMDIDVADKVNILNTLYNNLPETASRFLSEMIAEADMPLKKQMLEAVRRLEEDQRIELYRHMVISESSFLRIHGLIGLSRLKTADAKNVIISSVGDPSPIIRRMVANFISCPGSNSEMAALVKLSSDPEESVARIAIKKMGKTKQHRFAFVNLIPKLLSPNVTIRKEAIEALRDITGTDLGYNFSASDAKRRQAFAKWEKLWEENEANPSFIKDLRKIAAEAARQKRKK